MHPYSQLPDQRFWKRFISNSPWREIPLGGQAKFQLSPSDKIATAGSCFAQHIARYLNGVGRSTYIAENPHPLVKELGGETDSYQLFSARYGNVYTARQCLEMVNQAFGIIPMIEDFVEQDGRVYDLLRPNAVPEGFPGWQEAKADRLYHLSCVKKLFETTNVFIFTLGLTESWCNTLTHHTYPVCPGTARGNYDPDIHHFHNFTYPEVMADLDSLIQVLLTINPTLKIILTVSPVPLVATYTDKNVLVASSYSKSVLRAVCGEIERRYEHVQYFPSFEIVGHAASFGQYLASDLRDVTERGVSHVMNCFFSTFLTSESISSQSQLNTSQSTIPAHSDIASLPDSSIFNAECEELYNEVITPTP